MGSFNSIVDATLAIQENAAPERNGGLIGYLMDSYKNNVSISEALILGHVEDTMSSGGFIAAIVFAAIFMIILIIVVVTVVVIHCSRKKFDTPKKISEGTNRKMNTFRSKIPNSSIWVIVQFSVIVVFVILTFAFLICSFVASSSLDDTLTADADDSNQNGLLPSLKGALDDTQTYVGTFTPSAQEASEPIIQSIISKADKLIGGSLKAFIDNFMESVGVNDFFTHANALNENLGAVITSMQHVEPLYNKLNDGINKVRFQYSDYVKKFNDALKDCSPEFNQRCQAVINMLNQPSSGTVDLTNVNIRAVTSLIYLMEAKNVTAEMISSELANGKTKVDEMIAEIYSKFDKEVNVSVMIKEMTDTLWREMNSTLSDAASDFSQFSLDIAKDTTRQIEGARYSVTTIVLVIALLSLCFCLGVAIYTYVILEDTDGFGYKTIPTKYRHILKLISCLLFLFLTLNIMVITITFLFGGYLRTEVCRYVEEHPTDKSGTMIIDSHANALIDAKWPLIDEMLASNNVTLPFPLPKPFDVIEGILTECAANKSILEALHVKDQINPSALADVDSLSGTLETGKEMMHKALGEIDASSMFPDDIDSLITDARQLADLFMDKVDYQTSVNELGKPILNQGASEVLPAIFSLAKDIKATDSYKSFVLEYVGNDFKASLAKMPELKEQKALLQKYFQTIQKFKYVDATIIQLQTALKNMKATMMDNVTLIHIGDTLFDKHISKNILSNAKEILTGSMGDILDVLGPCRLVYDAYSKVVDGTCTDVVYALNILWFCMAFCLGFFTPLIILMLIVTTKLRPTYDDVDSKKPLGGTVIENPAAFDTSNSSILGKPALKYHMGINNNPDFKRSQDNLSFHSLHSVRSETQV